MRLMIKTNLRRLIFSIKLADVLRNTRLTVATVLPSRARRSTSAEILYLEIGLALPPCAAGVTSVYPLIRRGYQWWLSGVGCRHASSAFGPGCAAPAGQQATPVKVLLPSHGRRIISISRVANLARDPQSSEVTLFALS